MTEQEKREKVIKGMEHCLYEASCCGCPYEMDCDAGDEYKRDAIALLKAQEPRVMTLEEAKSAFVVEYRSGKMREVGSALLDINVDPANAEYGKIYRVWTSRPTYAQREAVKWNGADA